MNPMIWASSLSTNVPSSAATHSTTHATPLNLPMKLEERVPWFIKNNYLHIRKPQTTTISSSVCSTLPFGNISLPSGASASTTISGTTITLPAALASAVKLQTSTVPKPLTTPTPTPAPQETNTIPTSPSFSSSDTDMESCPMQFDDHELVCAEVLASLKQSAATEGFFVRRLSVSKTSSEDDSEMFSSLSKAQKKKVKRNINPCPDHRRKHQRCPPGCNGRRSSKDMLTSHMEAPIMKDEEMLVEAFTSAQHPQSTTTVTA